MIVCRHWHDIMLSTPWVHSQLWLQKSTKVEVVQTAIQRRRWLLDVIVDPNDERIQGDINMDEFHASFTTAIQAASRWRSLELRSFPPPGKHRELHILQPLEKLESFTLSQVCDLGSFLAPLMRAVIKTANSHLTEMDLGNDNAVLYLMKPAHLHIFCSLKYLRIWLSRRMKTPANILPYLQRLVVFRACHLHLPIYPPDTSLPIVKTLQTLELKSVSVQWMAGKVFPALQDCTIIYPHRVGAITLQPVTMPSCVFVEYHSNDLVPLRCFGHAPLAELRVTCGQWNGRRGNLQLVVLCPVIAASAQRLTKLDLEVRCSEKLLVHVLNLVPVLDELSLRLTSPHALSGAFFRAFVTPNYHAESPSEMVGLPTQVITPELRVLDLHYKRWLRDPERTALIPVFGDIVASHWPKDDFYLWLNFDGCEQYWRVERPIESLHQHSLYNVSAVGVLEPHGIVLLAAEENYSFMDLPFKEAEYLIARDRLSIACLSSLHCLAELRVGDMRNILPAAPPYNLPLFHTLIVLEVYNIHQSFLIGQTFHKLESCRILSSQEGHNLIFGLPTEMPVCTRLDVEDLTLLATLKLPQICELGVPLDHPESNLIWEKYISVNARLSGLRILHIHRWEVSTDMAQILGSLPVLEKLIIGNGQDLDVSFFRAFIPVGDHSASELKKRSRGECHIPPKLCPMLESLCVEGVDPRERPGLPFLEEVVTIRAMGGSPLRRLTFSRFQPKGVRKIELIKRDGSFGIEIVADERFELLN